MPETVGLYGVMRLYTAEDGYHYDCKMCSHMAKPFSTREARKKAMMAHLHECWPAFRKAEKVP